MKGSEKKDGSRKSEVTGPHRFRNELTHLRKKNLLRTLTCIQSSRGSRVVIKGKTYLNFSSNDYLNLSGHPAIINAAARALAKYGFGSGASRLLSGTFTPHMVLEDRVAQFKKTESALVFNTGYAANTGAVPALAGPDAVIFSDELNHASIVDGTRLSKAKVKIYRHRDVDHLDTLLKKTVSKKSIQRKIVITDTVFSMDGDIAPLRDILYLCDRHGAILMIDDAHGTGVLGQCGRGALDHFSIGSDGIIQMGTLSKAAGCYGAYIAGSRDLINLLINRARSFMYSTALPPAVAAGGIKAIDIIEKRSKTLRNKLWKNRKHLHQGLEALGYDTLGSETPVIPILMQTSKSALEKAGHLFESNIFAPAIRPPTVPDNKCRIRFSVTAGHRREDIERVIAVMSR